MRPPTLPALRTSAFALPLLALMLVACNPTYNWREHASPGHDYMVLFPAKPASFTRTVDLDGLQVEMTMTAAEAAGATFAVGSASVPDATHAPKALAAMRSAMLRNIGAADAAPPDISTVDAQGRGAQGQAIHLSGRFVARGVRVYQVIVVRPVGATPPEQVEQFLTSFTLLPGQS